MNAYKINDDIVAAENPEQAIGTWAAVFAEDSKTAGPCEEIDAATYQVNYEQDDGSFKPGPLSHLIYAGMAPDVIIYGDGES